DIVCQRLAILTDGHAIERLHQLAANIRAEETLVVGVGLSASLVQWAFPKTQWVIIEDESPSLLWQNAEAALMTTNSRPTTQSLTRPRVFLSHSHRDEGALFPAIETLREHFQIPLFVCADSIAPGGGWLDEIRHQLHDCDRFVFVVSTHANDSVFCGFEAGMAMALGKPIHLVSLDAQLPPLHLQHLQAVCVKRLLERKPWLTAEDGLVEALLSGLLTD
ncbi:MAG TPA: hypothetical protein DIU15_02640, partial [Deltaproteobacteria bacterium]|nr:hypothetical protein [Deltaproteobacteria bacterium]